MTSFQVGPTNLLNSHHNVPNPKLPKCNARAFCAASTSPSKKAPSFGFAFMTFSCAKRIGCSRACRHAQIVLLFCTGYLIGILRGQARSRQTPQESIQLTGSLMHCYDKFRPPHLPQHKGAKRRRVLQSRSDNLRMSEAQTSAVLQSISITVSRGAPKMYLDRRHWMGFVDRCVAAS